MRRGETHQGFMVGLILMLILLVIATPLYGQFFKKAKSDVDALQSCDAGIIGALAGEGGEAKCFTDATCKTRSGDGGTETSLIDYHWQPLGRGFGCPPSNVCCLKIGVFDGDVDVRERSEKICALAKGKITITVGSDDGAICHVSDESIFLSIDTQIKLQYVTKEGETITTVKYQISDKKGGLVLENSVSNPVTIQSISELIPIIDRYKLNEGGKLKVMANEQETSFTIAVPENKYCRGVGVCANQPEGIILDRVVCFMREDDFCMPQEIAGAQCKKIIRKIPETDTYNACAGVRLAENAFKRGEDNVPFCYVDFTPSGINQIAYLCKLVEMDSCEQVMIAREGEGILPWSDSTYDDAHAQYKNFECGIP